MAEKTEDITIQSLTQVSPKGGDLEGAYIITESLTQVSPKGGDLEGAGIASVLCFGEILMRLSPPNNTSWLHNHQVHINLAGAECNVAVALAKWGIPVKYCTVLPGNDVSASIIQYLGEKGIDTSTIHFSGSKTGLLYIQQGTDLKHGGVIYDRKYSSFGELVPGMIDWDTVLKGVTWFHFSAINPALGENTVAVCREALMAAKQRGITISVDLNYRAKLWQYGKLPQDVMPELAEYCDVVMGNIWSANTLLGTPLDQALLAENTREAFLDHACKTSEAIQKKFNACKTVACTFRFDKQPSGIEYYATLYSGNKLYVSGEFEAGNIQDKIGSGDCFMAALIYGIYNNHAPANVIEYAAAAAFGKLQEKGDFTNHSIEDIHKIIKDHAYTI